MNSWNGVGVKTVPNMPNMNGIELVKALRAHPAHKFTPILMLNTESSDTEKERGKQASAMGWIVKPFNPEKLLQIAKKVTEVVA